MDSFPLVNATDRSAPSANKITDRVLPDSPKTLAAGLRIYMHSGRNSIARAGGEHGPCHRGEGWPGVPRFMGASEEVGSAGQARLRSRRSFRQILQTHLPRQGKTASRESCHWPVKVTQRSRGQDLWCAASP